MFDCILDYRHVDILQVPGALLYTMPNHTILYALQSLRGVRVTLPFNVSVQSYTQSLVAASNTRLLRKSQSASSLV
jgi:hypothetical protein